MKIWHWSYHDDDSGSSVVNVWGSSHREVRSKLRAAEAQGVSSFHPFGDPVCLDVPTSRRALIEFLERYASNG
jgi:hypothetical protein